MTSVDISLLEKLVPVNRLPEQLRARLVQYSEMVDFRKGQVIFDRDDNHKMMYYLCHGKVNLETGDGKSFLVGSNDEIVVKELCKVYAETRRAIAVEDSSVLIINRQKADMYLHKNENRRNGPRVYTDNAENGTFDDQGWVESLLSTALFKNIINVNSESLLGSLEIIKPDEDEFILHQGELNNYLYYIYKGVCEELVRPSAHATPLRLARLEAGSFFGEETLITGDTSRTSIKTITPGILVRLSKENFDKHINNNHIISITPAELDKLDTTRTVFIDVRYPDEVSESEESNITNIPLDVLRFQAGKFDKACNYVIVCNNGRKSRAAVFVLSQYGIQSKYVQGGLQGIYRQESGDLVNDESGETGNTGPDSGKKPKIEDYSGELLQASRQACPELHDKLGQLRNILEEINRAGLSREAVSRIAEEKARDIIHFELESIRNTMRKVLSVYEETRNIKEKLLEDHITLKNHMENQTKRQEEILKLVEGEAREKITDELERINSFYADKELQIRKLQKLKDIADRKLLENRVWQKNRNSGQSDSFVSDDSERKANSPSRLQVDIDAINASLKREYARTLDSSKSIDHPDRTVIINSEGPARPHINVHDHGKNPDDNAMQRLRILKEQRELMRKIYKHTSSKQEPDRETERTGVSGSGDASVNKGED